MLSCLTFKTLIEYLAFFPFYPCWKLRLRSNKSPKVRIRASESHGVGGGCLAPAVWHSSWGYGNKYLLIPDRNPQQTKVKIPQKVQLGAPMSFNGVSYRNMSEGLLIEAAMTQSQLHHQTPAWEISHKSCKPGAHCSSCRQLKSLASISPRQLR